MTRFQGELDRGQLWKLLFCLPQCFLNRYIHTHSFIFIMKQLTIMLLCTLLFCFHLVLDILDICLYHYIKKFLILFHSYIVFFCLFVLMKKYVILYLTSQMLNFFFLI